MMKNIFDEYDMIRNVDFFFFCFATIRTLREIIAKKNTWYKLGFNLIGSVRPKSWII